MQGVVGYSAHSTILTIPSSAYNSKSFTPLCLACDSIARRREDLRQTILENGQTVAAHKWAGKPICADARSGNFAPRTQFENRRSRANVFTAVLGHSVNKVDFMFMS